MKRNPERPGLGFQSKSTALQPPKTAPSLFGLISQVNQGVHKPGKNTAEKAFGAAEQAAKDIAEKLAVQNSIQKHQHLIDKRNQFLAAKANVERLFKGGVVSSQQQPQRSQNSGGVVSQQSQAPRPQTTGSVIPQLQTQGLQTTRGVSLQQSQAQKPPLATSSSVFKVPPPKFSDTKSAKAGAGDGRPGLGFEENTGKKYVPKVDVGVGRNLFSEEENKTKQGKFSLVPYSYDKESDDTSSSTNSRNRQSSSSSTSKGGRKFTEEKRKSDSRGREKNSKSNRDTSSKPDLKDDYLKYGYGKEGPVPSVEDVSYYRSGSEFGNSNTESYEYVGDSEEYQNNGQYKVGYISSTIRGDVDLSSRNENDIVRFMNETNLESRSPSYDENKKNKRSRDRPQSDDYSRQDFGESPLAAPFVHPVDVDFGVPPPAFDSSGHPMFIPAVPFNLVPLPLGPVDMGSAGDNYHDDGGGYEHHYGDDRDDPMRGDDDGSYGMMDNFGNYGVPVYDTSVQRNDSDFGYEEDLYDESYGDDGYNRSPGRFGDDQYNQMEDNYHSGSEYDDYDRRSPRSLLSPGRYYSPDRSRYGRDGRRDRRSRSFDRARDSRSRSPRIKSKYSRKDSGWYNVDPDDKERLSFLESKMGYLTQPRSRDRSFDRGSSVERFRGRSPLLRSRGRSPRLRSRSRSRSRGNRSLSRGRRDSQRRSARGDSRGSSRSAQRTEENVVDQVRGKFVVQSTLDILKTKFLPNCRHLKVNFLVPEIFFEISIV